MAKVTKVGKNELEINEKSTNKTYILKTAKSASVTQQNNEGSKNIRFSDIEEEQELIAVGELKEDTFTARTIHVTSEQFDN